MHTKIKEKRLNKQFEDLNKFSDFVIPLFTREEYTGSWRSDKKYKWQCVKCGNVFEIPTLSCEIPRCLKCYPKKISALEKHLAEFCIQYFPNLIQHDRTLIKPYELDIVIPEIKLAIEFNGNYWHSFECCYLSGYHLMKTELCESNDYRLIHIWEDDWKSDSNLIKSKLIDVFENKETIDISKPLDRCWYSTLQFKTYSILPPEITIHGKFQTENCGYLIVKE